MQQSRRTFLSIIAATAVAGGAIYAIAVPEAGTEVTNALMGPSPVHVMIASSVTKQRWLEAAGQSFAASGARTSSGAPIEIEVKPVLSGDSMLQILNGTMTPTVWSPGESTWVEQFNETWGRTHSAPPIKAECTPTVLTPMGFAIWRPMAEALGWPNKPIGWKTLIELANDPRGWASLGHPEWGKLKLGHTHPQFSSAGLLFLASVVYAQLGKTTGLSVEDVYSPAVTAALTQLEQNTTKYGIATADLLTKMSEAGPDFLHVAAAFEEATVRFNVERKDDLRWPLTFIFPSEGTFWSDHPYCVLDGSGWVTAEQADAANRFRDYILSDAIQARAEEFYIRPLSPAIALGKTLSLENGTDPIASPTVVPAFAVPAPSVSESIVDQFMATKRKATTMIVLDVSGSMNGERIRTATEATAEFLSRFSPQDRVGLIQFSDTVQVISDPRPVSDVAEDMKSKVLNLVAGGGTNLYAAVCRAVTSLRAQALADTKADERRVYGVVLLSDGDDTVGEMSETRLFNECLKAGQETESLKIFTINFGGDSKSDLLMRLAQETHGAMFDADPASINATYLKISAEQ